MIHTFWLQPKTSSGSMYKNQVFNNFSSKNQFLNSSSSKKPVLEQFQQQKSVPVYKNWFYTSMGFLNWLTGLNQFLNRFKISSSILHHTSEYTHDCFPVQVSPPAHHQLKFSPILHTTPGLLHFQQRTRWIPGYLLHTMLNWTVLELPPNRQRYLILPPLVPSQSITFQSYQEHLHFVFILNPIHPKETLNSYQLAICIYTTSCQILAAWTQQVWSLLAQRLVISASWP